MGIKIILAVLLLVPLPVSAQQRAAALDQRSRIELPVDYRDGVPAPVVVFLPYTNGTAVEQARAFGVVPGDHESAVLILPPGRYGSNDYLPDFTSFVGWYEERVLEDLSYVAERYSVDTSRVYLAGYSLGGDLAWALSVRNPNVFAGAVMGGTRTSYPADGRALRSLNRSGYRGAFLIGERDAAVRFDGMNRSRSSLEEAGVPVFYREYPGGHVNPPAPLALEALGFVLGDDGDSIARASAPGVSGPRSGTGRRSALFTSSRAVTDRIILEGDLPLSVSRRYSTGVGLADVNRIGVRGESLVGDFWVRGNVVYRSVRTSADGRVHSVSSDIGVGGGSDLRFGAGIGWNWEQWASGFADTATGSELFEGPVLRFYTVVPGTRQHTPAVVASIGYRIPHAFQGVPAVYLFPLDVDVLWRATSFLDLEASAFSSTVQSRPVSDRSELAEVLDYRAGGALGATFRLGGELRLGLSYRGEHFSPAAGGDTSEYKDEWRLTVGYILY